MFPGSTLSDHCLRYQNIPEIKMIVVLGELGGQVFCCLCQNYRAFLHVWLPTGQPGEWMSVKSAMRHAFRDLKSAHCSSITGAQMLDRLQSDPSVTDGSLCMSAQVALPTLAVSLSSRTAACGGQDEYSLVEALKAGAVTKPVVAWVSGTCATLFKSEVQFGHAGAKSGGAVESAQVCGAQCSHERCAVMPSTSSSFAHRWSLERDLA